MLSIQHKNLQIMDKHDFAVPGRRSSERSSVFRRIIIVFLAIASLHIMFRHSYGTNEVNQAKKKKPFDWFDVR
jgi:transcriptional regulator of NAD metabolism